MTNLTLKIKHMPKKRPIVTRGGTFMPKGYQSWKRQASKMYQDMGGYNYGTSPLSMTLTICKPIPKSWTKNMKANIDHTRLNFDVDNLALLDALEGVAYDNDKQILRLCVEKKYIEEGEDPCYIISIGELLEW